MELNNKKYSFGIFGDEKKGNGAIIELNDKITPWFVDRHPEIKRDSLYALAGSLWDGQLRFKMNDELFWGDQLNVVQQFGGTGYCIYVVDKNYLKQ